MMPERLVGAQHVQGRGCEWPGKEVLELGWPTVAVRMRR